VGGFVSHAADVWTIVATFPTTVPQENSSQSGIVLLPPLRTSAPPSSRGTRRSRSGHVACGGSLRPAHAARRGLTRAPALGRCPCERVCASRTPEGSGVRLVLASTLVCARRVCACGRVDVRWREVARGRAGGRYVKKRPKQLVGGRARLLGRGPCDALHWPVPQLGCTNGHCTATRPPRR